MLKEINATAMDYTSLNQKIRAATSDCRITGCIGQRFLAAGACHGNIEIAGIPGNALGAYLNGASIKVHGNVQDAVGDTMNSGSIIIDGNAGDALGYSMRGGEIYVKGNAGYRAGVHMKEYQDKKPLMVIGGNAGSFLGEYQAGGLIVVLGLHQDSRPIAGYFPCTGMYGGKVIFRGDVSSLTYPAQTTIHPATEEDMSELLPVIRKFCTLFSYDPSVLLADTYTVITPDNNNPYRQMYVAN